MSLIPLDRRVINTECDAGFLIYEHFLLTLSYNDHTAFESIDLKSGSLTYFLNRNLGYLHSISLFLVECL